jgi:hypothetical protein
MRKLAALMLILGGALGVSARVPCTAAAAACRSASITSLPSTFPSSTSPPTHQQLSQVAEYVAAPAEASAPLSMASISVPDPVPSATEDAENIRKAAVQGISSSCKPVTNH